MARLSSAKAATAVRIRFGPPEKSTLKQQFAWGFFDEKRHEASFSGGRESKNTISTSEASGEGCFLESPPTRNTLDTLDINLGGVSQGSYTLIATDMMGCSDTLSVTILIDGINTPEPLVLSIYPNPSSGRINLVSTSHLYNAFLTVYDIQGRVVFSQNLHDGTGNTALDLKRLHNGMYQLVIRTGTSVSTTRIVIQH